MKKHFTTYKPHNHHQYYNIMYHQRFKYNSNINFMISKQIEKQFDGRLFFVHLYIDV